MRKITLISILFLIAQNATWAQSLDSLKKTKERMVKNISLINDSIKKIDKQINTLETQFFILKYKDNPLKVVCKQQAKLRKNPDPLSVVVANLSEGTIVTVIDYVDGYLGVCSDTICGYLNDMWITPADELNKFIEFKKEEIYNLKKTIADKEAIENAEQETRYIKKYGTTVYNKLKKGKVWIGMDRDMTIIALDYPEKINRTVTRYGVHEQWVYSNMILYFEDGILNAFQD